MVDIALCINQTCPKRESCFRFMARPNPYYQSYGEFKPKPDGSCNMHYQIIETDEIKDKNE